MAADQATPPPAAPTTVLTWVDAETNNPLFTIDDIVRFDWDQQIFELSPERATQLLALPVIKSRDFLVKDREGVIYRGRFYRSSAAAVDGFDGSTILIDQGPLKKLPASPFFTINGGYPAGGGPHDGDRFSPRLQKQLADAGVLSAITPQNLPVQRLWSGHTWVGGEQVLKASAVLFPETFRVGNDAYLHLLLYKGQRPEFSFDALILEVTCTANDGKFQSQQQILTVKPPLLDNGIYVCKFRPWEGVALPSIVAGVNMPAAIKTTAALRYPKDAVNEDRGGTVTAVIAIDATGKPQKVEITQGSGSEDIDKSVLRVLPRWTFTPALAEGKPASGVLKMQFVFTKGKIEHRVLPPEPVKTIAPAGQMDLSFTIIALKKANNELTRVGSWPLPPRTITLLSDGEPVQETAATETK